jgi:signal transduction histidine kinase
MSRKLRSPLIGAALGVLMAGVLIVVGLSVSGPAIRRATLEAQLSSIEHSACDAAPASWGLAGGGLEVFAYDKAGRAANPKAPPLEADLLRRVVAKRQFATRTVGKRLIAVVPFAPKGPCALLRVASRNVEDVIKPRFSAVLLLSVVGGMLLAVIGTFWFIVAPLRGRIEGLAAAARGVGSETFMPQQAGGDALGHIAEVLARSHDRIIDTRRALERRNQALEHHLAGIAHDLRTPLSSMHLALEALAAESDGALQDEARRALADVVYLSSMVENLHQATRLRHEVDVASGSVELADLVRRLEQRFAIVGRHAGVDVASNVPEHDVWAACTPALAERAVANLVQNAIEHNASPGHVALTLSLLEDGERFELVVADDGPGLPDGALASLDDEAFLLEGARRRGPGLGMLIAAEIARRAGWTLSYEPLEPKGLQARVVGAVTSISDR